MNKSIRQLPMYDYIVLTPCITLHDNVVYWHTLTFSGIDEKRKPRQNIWSSYVFARGRVISLRLSWSTFERGPYQNLHIMTTQFCCLILDIVIHMHILDISETSLLQSIVFKDILLSNKATITWDHVEKCCHLAADWITRSHAHLQIQLFSLISVW